MASNSGYYIATAYQSGLVKYSVTGHFTQRDSLELLNAKTGSLELSRIEGEELCETSHIPFPASLYGLWSFRPEGYPTDCVVLLTKNFDLVIVQFERLLTKVKIVEKYRGKYANNADLSLVEAGPVAAFHLGSPSIICLALYKQRFEIIKFDHKQAESFVIRVENHDIGGILGLEFLMPGEKENLLSMAMLQNTRTGPLLTFFDLNLKNKEKEKPEISYGKLDLEADLMLRVPLASASIGVLVVGNGSVQFYNKEREYACAVSPFLARCGITAWCILYENLGKKVVTYLVGCCDGRLVLVVCRLFGGSGEERKKAKLAPCKINVELLGVTTVAQTIASIGHGLVYLGAAAGPGSVIIRMRENINPETKNYFDVLTAFPTLGSILELQVIRNTEKSGLDESCLLACTADTFGSSMTVVRSGIKLENPVEIPVPGILNVWIVMFPALHSKPVFVLSTLISTRCAVLENEDLVEIEVGFGGFRVTDRTILCEDFTEDFPQYFLQVTSSAVVVIDRSRNVLVKEWRVPDTRITAAISHQQQLLVACGNQIRFLSLETNEGMLSESEPCGFTNEICGFEIFAGVMNSFYCVVGEWQSYNISIVKLPERKVVQESLVSDAKFLPRSFCACDYEEAQYLFCGFTDGSVCYFKWDEEVERMVEPKRVSLGTRPLSFVPFTVHGNQNVFVCSDRPCVISYRNGKLSFANVNIPNVVDVCALGSGMFEDIPAESLMVITTDAISIGQLEEIQKLQLIPQSLGFQGFRFAPQPETHSVGVVGDRKDCRVNKFSSAKPTVEEEEERIFYVVDRSSFEVITSYRNALAAEYFTCICSWKPDEIEKPFFIIGSEKAARGGSVIALQLIDSKLQEINMYTCDQPVRNIASYGKYLLATGETDLYVFEWRTDGHHLDIRATYQTCCSIIAQLDVLGDTILISDIQKGLVLLRYDDERQFQVLGKDLTNYSLQAVCLIDAESVAASDDAGNVLILKLSGKPMRSTLIEDEFCQSVELVAGIGMTDPVTSITRGAVVKDVVGEEFVQVLSSLVFGTCKGQIGVIFELDKSVCHFLEHLEQKLLERPDSRRIGGLGSGDAMRFCNRLMESQHFNFVNGDLVEAFSELDSKEMTKLVKSFKQPVRDGTEQKFTVTDAVKILDELCQMH